MFGRKRRTILIIPEKAFQLRSGNITPRGAIMGERANLFGRSGLASYQAKAPALLQSEA